MQRTIQAEIDIHIKLGIRHKMNKRQDDRDVKTIPRYQNWLMRFTDKDVISLEITEALVSSAMVSKYNEWLTETLASELAGWGQPQDVLTLDPTIIALDAEILDDEDVMCLINPQTLHNLRIKTSSPSTNHLPMMYTAGVYLWNNIEFVPNLLVKENEIFLYTYDAFAIEDPKGVKPLEVEVKRNGDLGETTIKAHTYTRVYVDKPEKIFYIDIEGLKCD